MNGSEASTEVVPTVEQASLNLRSLLARPLAQQPALPCVVAGSRSLASKRALLSLLGDDGALDPRCLFSTKRSVPSYVFRRKAPRYAAAVRSSSSFSISRKRFDPLYMYVESKSRLVARCTCKSNRGPSLPHSEAIVGRALDVATLVFRYYWLM